MLPNLLPSPDAYCESLFKAQSDNGYHGGSGHRRTDLVWLPVPTIQELKGNSWRAGAIRAAPRRGFGSS